MNQSLRNFIAKKVGGKGVINKLKNQIPFYFNGHPARIARNNLSSHSKKRIE